MVLNPEKAVELTQEQEESISELEKIIDDVVEKEFDPKNPSKQIQAKLSSSLEPKVEQELKRMYETAGWNVQIYSEIVEIDLTVRPYTYVKISKPDKKS